MKLKTIVIAVLISTSLLFSGCGTKVTGPSYKIKLEVWGLFDSSDIYNSIIVNYKQLNPQITEINYRKLTPETYKRDIVDAMASGQGPDIFLINNTGVPSFRDKIAPAPKGNTNIITEQWLKNDFVDVVVNDFFKDGNIYALPISVDSLALYYNKDLFNEAGITFPPKNWDEFTTDAKLLTKTDANNRIIQSGAAMGTAYNINRSTDIVSLLMIQRGAEMNSSDNKANFDKSVQQGGQYSYPGESALTFYTQFASTRGMAYSWNSLLHNSIDAFGEGTLAMMLNYSWQIETIRAKSPKLNFAMAPIPQLSNTLPVNYANYWGYAVTKNKTVDPSSKATNDQRISEAWRFITYLTTNPAGNINKFNSGAGRAIDASFDPAKVYLAETKKPAGRRDIIDSQKGDADLGAFASGNIIAKNWWQSDPDAVESVFAEMIDNVNKGKFFPAEAINAAAAKINKTQ